MIQPTSHPLDGARLKIIRAQEQVHSLKDEIAMYLQRRPWAIGTKKYGNVVPPAIDIVVPPPPRLSTIIGDCVVNSRAALDYIVWELAVKYFDPPFDAANANDRRITSFPIVKNPADAGYINRLNCLANRKIPTPAINEIKAAQPHNAGHEPLWFLHELVNTDKHRMPVLTLAYSPAFIWITDGDGRILSVGGQLNTYRDAAGKVRPDVKEEVAITVTFQDITMPREPVDITLENIIDVVANVVPRFSSLL